MANPRNVSSRISLWWPIHIINPVNKTKLSSNVVFEELGLSNRIALPLIKPLLIPGGWHEVKCVY